MPYPLVTVCTSGAAYTPLPCTPKASIYSDAALTVPLANPFRGDMFGNIEFYATPAAYIVSVTAPYSPGYSFKMSASGGFAGTIATTQVAFGSAVNTISGSPNFTWDNATKSLTATNSGSSGNAPIYGIATGVTVSASGIVGNCQQLANFACNGGQFTAGDSGAGPIGSVVGISGVPSHLAAGTLGTLTGLDLNATVGVGAGAITTSRGIHVGGVSFPTGTSPTTHDGIIVDDQCSGSFPATNCTGLRVAAQSNGKPGVSAANINGIRFVDGNATGYATLAAALAAVPAGGAHIIDTLVEAFTVNPFASTTNPVWVEFGAGIWTTTVPIVLSANQWITGAGPQFSKIKAVAGFSSTTLGVITLGNGVENHAMYARDIGIDCNSIANCTGEVFDGAQNPTGSSNVVITNYRVDGVRLQQTSAATSGVKLHDMWAYSPTGIAPSGAGVNVSAFSGIALVENFTQASDHSFPGPSAFKAGGGSGEFTCIHCAGEGITDQFLLTGTSVTSVIIGASQQASSSPGVNTVHVGAGVSNYNLINVSQGNSTGAALVDDQRSYTCTGSIQFLVVSGGSTKFDFGSCPTVGWIRTPATTTLTADLIQLQAGFTGTSSAYKVLSDAGAIQYSVSNDGRPTFRGGQTGAFKQVQTSDTLTADRTPQYPNGNSATVMVANFTTAGATTSDVIAVQGMTASGHCNVSPSNALAATGFVAGTTWLDTPGANVITLHHTNTNGQVFSLSCTSN